MDQVVSNTNSSMEDYYNLIKAEHEANNAWSAEQAQKAMDYQTEMSNTAHQREVADLKAAGLNPVLSAGGSGATTGSGMAAQRSDENVQALYGLAKQAIEANIVQAQSMANSAKYSSGHAGYGAPVVSEGVDADIWSIGEDIAADILKKKYGINPENSKKAMELIRNYYNEFADDIGYAMAYIADDPRDNNKFKAAIGTQLNKAKGINDMSKTIKKLANKIPMHSNQAVHAYNMVSSAKDSYNYFKAKVNKAVRR